jgi:hypothetical protein
LQPFPHDLQPCATLARSLSEGIRYPVGAGKLSVQPLDLFVGSRKMSATIRNSTQPLDLALSARQASHLIPVIWAEWFP